MSNELVVGMESGRYCTAFRLPNQALAGDVG